MFSSIQTNLPVFLPLLPVVAALVNNEIIVCCDTKHCCVLPSLCVSAACGSCTSFFWSLDPVGINIYKSVGDPISYRFLVPIIVSATSCMMMHAKDHFIMMIIVSKATVLNSLNRKKFCITNN